MVPEASVLEPTTAKGSLQDGVDSLWKFQVRKENSILLESYEGHTKLLQSLAAENLKNKKDFDERMAALEATVRHLQSEERKDRHAFEKYSEEMATLRTQIGGVVDKLERHDQRLDQGITFSFHVFQYAAYN
jgi:exonuclease VII small subunit